MEPIPETVGAIEELGPFAADGDLLDELNRKGRRVCALVPDCVGLSLVSAEHGVTFTLTASETQIDVLDAIQCLADGSGTHTTRSGEESTADDPLDEEAWRRCAVASAARGVLTTLTIPILTDGVVTGTVNLYGASSRAFTGLHDQLAAVFDAWAPGAVVNADLAFTTRREAELAPQRLRRQSTTERVAHLVAHAHHVSLETAHQRVREAAARAGITEEQLAEAMIRLRRRPR